MSDVRFARWFSNWFDRCLGTVPRCHVVGASIAISIILGTAWVLSLSAMQPSVVVCGDEVIDRSEALALIENADQWRDFYTVSYRESQEIQQRASQIAQWLPTDIDWDLVESELRQAGEITGVNVLSIEEGKRQIGTRVGILSATCQVEGTYPSLCRFLQQLHQQSQPIACNEMTLHRDARSPLDDESAQPSPRCRVSLSLRIPYAAEGTASGKLLLRENSNAI